MKYLLFAVLIFITLTGVAIMGFEYISSVPFDSETQERIDSSSQLIEGRFNGANTGMNLSKFAKMLRERFCGANKPFRRADSDMPSVPVDLGWFNAKGNQLNATWLGHSTLLVNIDGYRIITDPVWTEKLTVLGPSRYNGKVPLDIAAIDHIDVIIISHNHYDHLNRETVERLAGRTERFVVPLGVGAYLKKWGVPAAKIIEMDWWESCRYGEGLEITATPAQHFSGRSLTDSNKSLWASWVISTPQHRIFFSGDSGYFDGFSKIGKAYGPFDMTFLECGAYNRMWRRVHMFPEQVAQAHQDLQGKVLQPVHWGTFNLALHPWREPMQRLHAVAAENYIQLSIPVPGQTTVYGQSYHEAQWWQEGDRAAQRVVCLPEE